MPERNKEELINKMISNRILVKTCTIAEVSGNILDAVGCPTGYLYSTVTSGIPCYYTQIQYETLEGKEPIKNVYRMYINTDQLTYVDTSMKVFVDNQTFDVLDTEGTDFGLGHMELILKKIGLE
jgi:hypothetical protein